MEFHSFILDMIFALGPVTGEIGPHTHFLFGYQGIAIVSHSCLGGGGWGGTFFFVILQSSLQSAVSPPYAGGLSYVSAPKYSQFYGKSHHGPQVHATPCGDTLF